MILAAAVALGISAALAGGAFDEWSAAARARRNLRDAAGAAPPRRRWTAWWASAAGGGAAFLAALAIVPDWPAFQLVLTAAGAALPWLHGREQSERRRRLRRSAFPDFLDLTALALSAGHTLASAWSSAAGRLSDRDLREELARVERAVAFGRSWPDAVDDLGRRLDDARLLPILVLFRQALRTGAPLQAVLQEQAEALRSAAMAAMEERAQTAGIRLLFPLVFFIFPTIFIVLFGPLVLRLTYGGTLF